MTYQSYTRNIRRMSTLIVKLTRDQHRQIKREARKYACTVSDLVRYLLLGPNDPSTRHLLELRFRSTAPMPFDDGPAPEAKP